jgi:hypothetical protein
LAGISSRRIASHTLAGRYSPNSAGLAGITGFGLFHGEVFLCTCESSRVHAVQVRDDAVIVENLQLVVRRGPPPGSSCSFPLPLWRGSAARRAAATARRRRAVVAIGDIEAGIASNARVSCAWI